MEAYKRFISACVERYDGDGKDDMPGLIYPIKYWEIMNQPESDMLHLSPENYLEVLKASAEAIRKTDPKAKVLQGGARGVWPNPFWEKVFEIGGVKYCAIGNYHFTGLNLDEALSAIHWASLMKKYKIPEYWLTEYAVQINKEDDLKEQAIRLLKQLTIIFESGCTRVFYTMYKPGKFEPGTLKQQGLLSMTDEHRPIYYTFMTMIDLLDGFSKVQKIDEGKFLFTVRNRPVYVLWDDSALDVENQIAKFISVKPDYKLKGTVNVTDYLGKTKQMNIDDLVLSSDPVIVWQ